ncbi:MAG TPA: Gfo/Idh/MocA family oxidoreductase [Casimicrobiaceae bacterium]
MRIGIVGADAKGQGWAPLAHFPALRALPEFEIAAICTAHPETARTAAQRYGVPNAYHDYREMFASPDVDVVSVVVRAPNHHEVVMAALQAGKPVYCEWPLGVNASQAEEMAALARANGIRTAVGLQARCDPTLRYVRDLVAQGYIGDVLAVTMTMISPGVPERSQSRMWERMIAGGVSALTIRAMHSLEALCLCVGELAEVSGRLATQVKQWRVIETRELVDVEVPDNVSVAGTLHNGAVISAHIATVPSAASGFRMEVFGREGTLTVSTSGAPQRDANKIMGARGGATLAPMETPAQYVEVPADTPSGPPSNVAHLYRRFGNAIQTNAIVEPDFEHALKRHRLIDAIIKSSHERRPIALP